MRNPLGSILSPVKFRFVQGNRPVQNGADLNRLKIEPIKLGDIWRAKERIMASVDANFRELLFWKMTTNRTQHIEA